MLKPRFLGDVCARDLINGSSGHGHPHPRKAPRMAVFQCDDGLRFNRFPEGIRVQQCLARKQMAQLIHLEVLQAGLAVFPREAQRAGQMVAAFLDGNR